MRRSASAIRVWGRRVPSWGGALVGVSGHWPLCQDADKIHALREENVVKLHVLYHLVLRFIILLCLCDPAFNAAIND